MRLHLDLDVGVARGSAVTAGLSLALEAQRLAALDARGNREVDAVAVGERDAFLGSERRLEEGNAQAMLGIGTALAHGAAAEPAAAKSPTAAAENLGQDVLDREAFGRALGPRAARS